MVHTGGGEQPGPPGGVEVCGYDMDSGTKLWCTSIYPVDPAAPPRAGADSIGVSALSADNVEQSHPTHTLPCMPANS